MLKLMSHDWQTYCAYANVTKILIALLKCLACLWNSFEYIVGESAEVYEGYLWHLPGP